MGINVITINGSGFTASIRCDCCAMSAQVVQDHERHQAIQKAERRAEDEGFAHYPSRRLWFCPQCRIKRLPDHLKASLPNLCIQYGVPVPGPSPSPATTPATGRKKRARSKVADPEILA